MSTLPVPRVQRSNAVGLPKAWLLAGILTWMALPGMAADPTPLEIYDAAIAADAALGPDAQVPVSTLTQAVNLTGTAGVAFDFGVTSGDVTMEFILNGDPGFGESSYLAVGTSNPKSRLVYESWSNTQQLGFTQGGVADYLFTPAVESPTNPSHVAFVWEPASTTLRIYVNGGLAGTTTGVDPAFAMPTGPGWLGAAGNTSDEAMKGTIHRVTVYDTVLPAGMIKRHASAYGGHVSKALAAYDAAIDKDVTSGLSPTARQKSTVVLNGSGGVDFDFGANSDDVTMEFILEGDPDFGNGAYLAVGDQPDSNLRYEVWGLPGQIGFTQLHVADYSFNPVAASPTLPTHVAYAWEAGAHTMKMYVNGALTGAATGISDLFVMPAGAGKLGANPGNSERMRGTIYRVTAYDSLLGAAAILSHAKVFADLLSPPSIARLGLAPDAVAAGQSATLSWEVKNATRVLVNGVDRTGTTNLSVSSPITATYTLIAENPLGKVSKTVRLQVNPSLAGYDAAILADQSSGLVPVSRLASAIGLTGDWAGVPFNFGAISGDATMEFIVEGDPTTGDGTAIATDYDEATKVWRHSLRYSQWDAAGQVGFTKKAVADYAFDVPVPTSTWPTHLAFVWDSASLMLKVYVNGTLASSRGEVAPEFGLPTGQGTLGEGMVGTIFRATSYSGQLPATRIASHAKAFLGESQPALQAYDTAIAASSTGGGVPAARLLAPVGLPGNRGITFSFGSVSGNGTVEFILEGDPSASVSSVLAVGAENPKSRLVFESWADTNQLGFTQGGVADYLFAPAVSSPTTATHVAYVWDPSITTMRIYVNGVLAGTTPGVDPAFALPSGKGLLGDFVDGGEAVKGTIYRVNVFDEILADTILAAHAKAFVGAGPVKVPALALDLSGTQPVVILSQGSAGLHYRVEYRNSLGATDTWQLLQDIPALSGTSARVSDTTAAAGRVQRFYRAVLVQ